MKAHLSLLITFCLLLSSMALFSEDVVVTFACENKNNFPWLIGNSDHVVRMKPGPGITIELMEMLTDKKIGIKVKVVRVSWPECKTGLKEGKFDGIFNASFKKKRMELGRYPWDKEKDGPDVSRRNAHFTYSVYIKKGSKLTWDPKEKKFGNLTKPLGAPAGYSIVGDLKKWGAEVIEEKTTEINFNKVLINIIDGAAMLSLAGDFQLKNNKKYAPLMKLQPDLVKKPYYLMLSHQFCEKNPELSEKIWDTIKELRETSLEDISKNYFK